jgi:hypothetical protein
MSDNHSMMITANYRVTFPMPYFRLGIRYRWPMFYSYTPWNLTTL